MFKKEKPCEAGRAHAVLLALAIGSAHGAPSGRLDLDGVQEGSQGLPEGPAERKDTGAGVGFGRRLPRPASVARSTHRCGGTAPREEAHCCLVLCSHLPHTSVFTEGISKWPALHFHS